MSFPFYFKNDVLYAEGLNLASFAEQTATPFYLYSQKRIKENCQTVIEAGKNLDFLPCFALKANFNPRILQLIQSMGFGADIVSGGELYFALKAGFPPEKIVFAGVGKTAREIELAIKTGIHSINVESSQEFQLIQTLAEQLQIKTSIAFRINPDIETPTHEYIATGKNINKFGIHLNDALPLYQQAVKNKWLNPIGLHVHIGSQILDVKPFLKAADYLLETLEHFKKLGLPITTLDLGGGIGIDYSEAFFSHPAWPLKEILPQFLKKFENSGLKIVMELGRSIIGDAGILVTKILYRKQTTAKKFLIVDAAMNNLIRPSLYKAYHPIVPIKKQEVPEEVVDIVGPVCESGDFLAQQRKLQACEQGEFLAIGAVGAYGQALASYYNLRPMIPEFLVSEKTVTTIFKGETIEEMANKFEW